MATSRTRSDSTTGAITPERPAKRSMSRWPGLGLRSGDRLEHDVEGPEEWRFALTVLDVRPDNESLPRVLERQGEIALEPEAELGGED